MTKLRITTYISDKAGSHLPASLTNAWTSRLVKFRGELRQAQVNATHAATATSLQALRRTRPTAQPRPGRNDRSIRSAIQWQPWDQGVRLNVQKLDNEAPHWIIQEIGTGNTANLRTGGIGLGVGRPRKDAVTRRHVPKQAGRRISRRLVWADQGGNFAQYSAGRHQLALASQVSGVPYRRKTIVIHREIKPQGFIKAGAKEGFRVYRQSVLSAARTTLTRKR